MLELRAENSRTIEPNLRLADETLKLERAMSDLVNQVYPSPRDPFFA